jgi:hypothetical protein
MKSALAAVAIALTMAIAAPAAADEPTPEAAPPPPVEAKATVTAEAPAPTPAAGNGTQKVVGAAVGAGGFLTMAVGTFFLFAAVNRYNEAESRCKKSGCTKTDVRDSRQSRDVANAGGIILLSGVAVLAAGITLWLTAPDAKKKDVSVGLAPSLGGLSAVGTF